MTPERLLRTIELHKRYGDDPAVLYALRVRLLHQLYHDRSWRCRRCGGAGAACRYDAQICCACDADLEAHGRRRCRQCGAEKRLTCYNVLRSGKRRRVCCACRRRRDVQAHRVERQAHERARYAAMSADKRRARYGYEARLRRERRDRRSYEET